jgi:hypothetical protein
MQPESKQNALAETLTRGVAAGIIPHLTALSEQLAKLAVSQSATLARLTTVETILGEGGAGAKRAVRTGAAKPAAAGKAGAAKGAANDPKSKVTNALLYFRYGLANDLGDLRETYATDAALEDANADPAVAKKNADTDPAGYYSAVGAFLWKQLVEDDKGKIRAQHVAWKEENAREGAEAPLEEDAAE